MCTTLLSFLELRAHDIRLIISGNAHQWNSHKELCKLKLLLISIAKSFIMLDTHESGILIQVSEFGIHRPSSLSE
jgi:hypothetical protein